MSRSPEATASQTQSWHGTPCAWLARLRGVVVVVVFTVLGGILAQFIPSDDLQDRPLKLNDPHSGATIAMILRRRDRRCIARAVVSFRQQAEVDFAASLITFGVGPSRSIPASDHVLVVDENGRLRETGVRASISSLSPASSPLRTETSNSCSIDSYGKIRKIRRRGNELAKEGSHRDGGGCTIASFLRHIQTRSLVRGFRCADCLS